MFHRHKWIVVEKQEQPSMLDKLIPAGVTRFKTGWAYDISKRDVIVHYRCEGCGRERVQRI